MMTNRLTRRGSSGSRISASAILVNGPVAHEDQAPGMGARGGDDRIDGVKRPGLLLGLGQDRMAEAGLAMDLARVPDRDR